MPDTRVALSDGHEQAAGLNRPGGFLLYRASHQSQRETDDGEDDKKLGPGSSGAASARGARQ